MNTFQYDVSKTILSQLFSEIESEYETVVTVLASSDTVDHYLLPLQHTSAFDKHHQNLRSEPVGYVFSASVYTVPMEFGIIVLVGDNGTTRKFNMDVLRNMKFAFQE